MRSFLMLGSWYLDRNCNPVGTPSPAQLCGEFAVHWTSSPISLIWDDKASKSAVLLSQFGLEPGKTGSWYLWRASAAMPLLVYDPEHSGDVRSATQLFGNWTFGGNKTASLTMSGAAVPWSNGYEALATLDEDGDLKLNKAELASLGLWFDRNQNGISEPGEVVDLRQAGVTALHVTPDHTDPVTGDVHAKLGYERFENGRTVTGASVDWFSAGYSSEAEAMLSLKAAAALAEPVSSTGEEKSSFSAAAASVGLNPLAGAWLWTANTSENVPDTQGVLTFKPLDSGKFSGHSYAELALNLPEGEAQKYLVWGSFSGEVQKGTSEDFAFTFTVIDGKNGAKTFTTARWVSREDRIYGESRQEIALGDEKDTRAMFSYSWTASRIGRE